VYESDELPWRRSDRRSKILVPACRGPLADAVRVLLWLFLSGVVALIVDEVCERITSEAREVMDAKGRERKQNPK